MGTVLSIGILVAVPVLAFRGDENARGPRFNPEHHEQMQEIFETGNFEAFRLMIEESGKKGKMLETITEENFSKFVEMHNFMKNGDKEGAKVFREELGLNFGKGPMMKQGRRGGMGDCKAWGKSKMMDLTEEERQEFKDAMDKCREDTGTWEETRECRKALIDRFHNQEQE